MTPRCGTPPLRACSSPTRATDGLEFARRLQAGLEAEGLSLYRDLSDLEGGEDWWRQVEAAIRSVEHVVLVLSPAALRSPYVTREWKLARQEGRKVSPVSARASSTSRICRAGWSARIATTLTCPGIFIDTNDALYVADSQSDAKVNPGFQKGIRIGSARDGIVQMLIPVPGPQEKPTTTTEGVAADARGNVYGAEANSNNLRKYTR